MSNLLPAGHFYAFGPFRLEPSAGVLWRDETVVPLTPKAIEALTVLVEGDGRVVTKAEMMSRLWPDTFVEEANLSHHIYRIREALGDQPGGGPFIETLPKRGYRFAAPVSRVMAEAVPVARPDAEQPPAPVSGDAATVQSAHVRIPASVVRADRRSLPASRPALALAAIAAVAALLAAGYAVLAGRRSGPGASPTVIESIAVLPFTPLSSADHDEALELGMANALITRLTSLSELRVRPTSAVLRYAGATRDPLVAGREQQVDAVIDGRIQRAGSRVRVTVQLLQLSEGRPIWAQDFDSEMTDLFALQDTVTEQIARALRLRLTRRQSQETARRETTSVEAYEAFLNGMYFNSTFTPGSFERAVDYFNQAVRLDPKYARAWAALGFAYSELLFTDLSSSTDDILPKAREYAQRAIELDETVAEAHQALATIYMYYDWDWTAAERECLRLIQLSPGAASSHQFYAWFLSLAGRFDEGLAEARVAQSLDPLAVNISGVLVSNRLWAHDAAAAITEAQRVLALHPDNGFLRLALAQALQQQGRFAEALSEIERAKTDEVIGRAALGHGYVLAGRRADAERMREALLEVPKGHRQPDYQVAAIDAALGNTNEAFARLESALAGRSPWMSWLKVEPMFDPIRPDPRFAALLARIGFK